MYRSRLAFALTLAALAAILLPSFLHAQITFERTYGGASYDEGRSVQQTTDGSYIVAGCTRSFGAGDLDVYLIKTNANGDTFWTRTFGGPGWNEEGWSIQQTADGGYVLAGAISSDSAGYHDVYLVKTDAHGDAVWTRTYGDTNFEVGTSVQQTADSGYVVAGHTSPYSSFGFDVYIVRTDPGGDTLWTRTLGGANDDWANSIQRTADGGYVIAGGHRVRCRSAQRYPSHQNRRRWQHALDQDLRWLGLRRRLFGPADLRQRIRYRWLRVLRWCE